MNIQDVNHGIQTFFLAGVTVLSDSVFEIIGALGVIVNLVFVYNAHVDKKKINKVDAKNKELEQELLRKQIEAIDEASMQV